MTDNFLHAQFADLLRRQGFVLNESDKRWTNPNERHIVVSFREDEYTVNGYAALSRSFNLRECSKLETALHSLLMGSSSRDKFKAVYQWMHDACTELHNKYPHTFFYVRMNDKAEPVLWFSYKIVDLPDMQVAHSEYLLASAKMSNQDKATIVLDYMAKNGFYQSLDTLPAIVPNQNTITYYVKPERLQNCELVALQDVERVEVIQFHTKTELTDAGNVSDDAALILFQDTTKHEYIAFTCVTENA